MTERDAAMARGLASIPEGRFKGFLQSAWLRTNYRLGKSVKCFMEAES